MPDSQESTLKSILKNIQSKLQVLRVQLDAEKKILEQHALDDIEPLLKEKQNAFLQLNADIVLLQDFFHDNNVAFTAKNINPYIQAASTDLQKQWELFMTTLKDCQEKNLINGLLVMGMKNYNDKLLGLLTQQTPQTYHPSQIKRETVSTREHKA